MSNPATSAPPLPPPPLPEVAGDRPQPRPGFFARAIAAVVALLVGTAQHTGWTTSVCLHAVVLTLLALILVPLDRRDPPSILTAANAENIGDAALEDVAEFVQEQASVTAESTQPVFDIGGSTGNVQPDLALLSGTPSGLGRGVGQGSGDGSGREADARIARAGGRGGVVQIAILWDDRNDLDLHVLTPGNKRICFLNPKSPDGAELDVDMNVKGESTQPVENIRWLTKAPADGRYRVQVHYFARHDRAARESPFRTILRIGDEELVLKGVARAERQFTEVATFEIKNGLPGSIQTQLKDFDESEVPEVANDPRRMAQREEFARAALDDALASTGEKLQVGKLRRLLERFPGTEAAAEARRRLQAIE